MAEIAEECQKGFAGEYEPGMPETLDKDLLEQVKKMSAIEYREWAFKRIHQMEQLLRTIEDKW